MIFMWNTRQAICKKLQKGWIVIKVRFTELKISLSKRSNPRVESLRSKIEYTEGTHQWQLGAYGRSGGSSSLATAQQRGRFGDKAKFSQKYEKGTDTCFAYNSWTFTPSAFLFINLFALPFMSLPEFPAKRHFFLSFESLEKSASPLSPELFSLANETRNPIMESF